TVSHQKNTGETPVLRQSCQQRALRNTRSACTVDRRTGRASAPFSGRKGQERRTSTMKYGINLLLWGANIGEAHYPLLEKIKSWGFDGVEIPTFGPNLPGYKKVGQKLKDIGLGCTTCTIVSKE